MRSTFTSEARGSVLQGLYAGLTLAESIERAGLPEQTVKNWLTRGRKDIDHGAESEYATFARAVDEAREVAATADLSLPEFRGCLAKAVRAGSVTAMRLWIEMRDREAAEDGCEDDPFAALDGAGDFRMRRAKRRGEQSVIDRLAQRRGMNHNNGGHTT